MRVSLIVFVVALGLLLVGNDRLILYSLDEARNAQCAREMYQRGNLVVPTYNGQLRTQKPPLAYYFMMGSYGVFGQTPFAARFPSAVFGALTVLLAFWLCRRYASQQAGLLAAGALLASLHFKLQMGMSVPDPLLILLILTALASFYRALQGEGLRYYALGYLFTGLAVMTKGPVAAWVVGATVLAYLALERKNFLKRVWGLYPLPGIALVVLICMPWVLAVQAATDGQWLREFIGTQNVQRFSEPLEGHGGFPGITLAFVVLGMLPTSVFLPFVVRRAWQARTEQPLGLFVLLAAGVVIITFLLAATRLPNYTVPAYPFLAIGFGLYLDSILQKGQCPRSWLTSWIVLFCIAVALPVLGYFGLKEKTEVAHLAGLAWWLLLLVPGVAGAFYYWLHCRPGRAMLVLLGGWAIGSVVGIGFLYPRIYQENPVTKTLPLIDTTQPVVAFDSFNPAYSFELPRLVPVYTSLAELQAYLASTPRATVLSRGTKQAELESLGLKVVALRPDLFENTTSLVLTWKRPEATDNLATR